jgi:hypothetical protein
MFDLSHVDLSHVTSALSLPTLGLLWKIVRMLSRIEMKVELLWDDYTERKKVDDDFRSDVARRLPHRGLR